MKVSMVVIVLTLAGCANGPPTRAERQAEGERIHELASAKPVPKELRPRDPGKPLTHDNIDEFFSPAYAFEIATSGRDDAATDIEAFLHWDPSAEEIAAAAMGLGSSRSDATERVLVDIAMRPSRPPEALEALFSYYRRRGADKPMPTVLPDVKLVEYETHPSARGRAALAHLGRAVKDPALVEVLERLAHDPDMEVRRAVAISLADGATTKRLTAERERCLAALTNLLRDPDAHVVASACRAVSSYTPPTSLQVQQLMAATNHADFNVRVAALEGLGKFMTKEATDWKGAAVAQMTKLATTDPSTSVRYTAGAQLAEIGAGLAIVDALLADPSEYVRTAGVLVLAKSSELVSNPRLAKIAKTDAHIRVREEAVGAFEGRKDSAIAKDAIRAALDDPDVGVVSTACGVAAKNGWTEFTDVLLAVPARFPGCVGADARQEAISAVSELAGASNRAFFESFLGDANPGPRDAAAKAIATLDQKEPPPSSRGADLSATGALLPGGAQLLGKDPILVVETDKGTMRIRLFPDQAPVHCAHVAALAQSGFYDGLTWHRVVPDFVIQGGCPRGDGSGNAGVTLPLEPTRIPFERGTLGMPRGDNPDTGGCQLFICHSRAPHLDVIYTAFGKVVNGLDVIDRIDVDSKIVRIRVEGAR
jgi:peptidyl-prolyl cis-trans isomerase B (cyclophilin B)